MRLVSNAVIVLTSREMLIQLITMASTLHQVGLASAASHITPPLPNIPRPQYEFELLQILDILYHTDSLSTYKRVVRALLSSSFSSQDQANSRLVLARMACASLMPEFKLVKRENWSSEEKRERDRGRVRRVRSSGNSSSNGGGGGASSGNGLLEDAIQFGGTSGSGTGAASGASLPSGLTQMTTSYLRQNREQENVLYDLIVTSENGCKPNDIERLTNPDSSNLLVIFDQNSSKAQNNSNKKLPINIDFFKKLIDFNYNYYTV